MLNIRANREFRKVGSYLSADDWNGHIPSRTTHEEDAIIRDFYQDLVKIRITVKKGLSQDHSGLWEENKGNFIMLTVGGYQVVTDFTRKQRHLSLSKEIELLKGSFKLIDRRDPSKPWFLIGEGLRPDNEGEHCIQVEKGTVLDMYVSKNQLAALDSEVKKGLYEYEIISAENFDFLPAALRDLRDQTLDYDNPVFHAEAREEAIKFAKEIL